MKKTICVILLAAFFGCVSGCQNSVRIPELKWTGDIGCVICSGDKQYECTASYVSDDVYSLSFSSPKELDGLKYSLSGGKCSISLGSLLCRSDSLFLPDNSCPFRVMHTISRLKKAGDEIQLESSEDGSFYAEYEGCRIYADAEGNLHLMIN